MFKAKFEDGEWVIVDDNEDIVDSADGRRDAVLKAARMNKESGGEDTGVTTHRGSSYGNKPDMDQVSEGVSDNINKALDYMYELTDDGDMAKNAYHNAKAKFKLGDTEAEILLNDWNDSHKSDRRNFIEVESINELSKKTLGSYVKKATTDIGDRKFVAGHRRGQLSGSGRGNEQDIFGDKIMTKADQRKRGINTAVRKLTNEVSDATLSSYIDKANKDGMNHRMRSYMTDPIGNKDEFEKHDRKFEKRIVGTGKAYRRMAGLKIVDEVRTKQPGDEDAAHELFLYATNDSDLYNRGALPIIANLQRKVKKGVYDAELAIKLWRYHADSAAKGYNKEYGGTFTPATRDMAAKQFRDYYDEDVQSVSESVTEDNIQELSKGTLTSYLRKSMSSSGENSASNLASRAANKLATFNPDSEGDDGDDGEADDHKSFMRSKGMNRALNRLVGEEQEEEINELSKDTLGRYINNASFDKSMSSYRQGLALGNAGSYHKRPDKVSAKQNAERALKREKGIGMAVKKLTRESVDTQEGKFIMQILDGEDEKIVKRYKSDSKDELKKIYYDNYWEELRDGGLRRYQFKIRENGMKESYIQEGKLKSLKDKFINVKTKAKDMKDPKVKDQLETIRSQIKAEEKRLKDKFVDLKVKAKDVNDPKIKKQLQDIRDQLKESLCESLEEAILNINFLNE